MVTNTEDDPDWGTTHPTQHENEHDIKDHFATKGHVKIWENIYFSITNKNINVTLEHIFNSNKSRFELTTKYVLSTPPNDYEKFLYIKSGSNSYLILSVVSSIAVILGYIFFAGSSPFLYIYFCYVAILCAYYFINHLIVIMGKDMDYQDHTDICSKIDISNITVDIYLPICGEDLIVLSNTWKNVCELDFPNFNVYVLDDGDSREVESLCMIYGFNYIIRDDRPNLKKSGNMRNAYKMTCGKYILVLDADFVPRKDFLKETIPLMEHDMHIGILQTPQYFRNSDDQSWLEKGAAGLQEVFYRVVQTSRNNFNATMCVGTSAIYRREALSKFGGSAPVENSEDVTTGLYVMNEGFKIKYLPLILSMGVCPGEILPFFTQQYRWAVGSFTLMLHNRSLWCGKNIICIQRICFMNGFSYYIFNVTSQFISPTCIIIILYFFPDQLTWFNILFVVPSLLNDIIFHKLWTTQNVKIKVMSFDKTCKIQNIAFFYSFKDAIFNTPMEWIATGNKLTNKNRSSIRLKTGLKVMFLFDSIVMTVVILGSVLRIYQNYPFYNFIYVMLQSVYQWFLSFYIITYFLDI